MSSITHWIQACVLLACATALGKDEWLCTQEASQIQNGALLACGIGQGKDENAARVKAFENAKSEFERVCGASDTCNGRQVSVEPKRTSCASENGSYKCYRLVTFTVGQTKAKPGALRSISDQPEYFSSFVYDPSADTPRLSKKMLKKDVLASFGAPVSVESDGYGTHFFYVGNMCEGTRRCCVNFDDGKVESWAWFKPIYTDDLK